MKRNWGLEIDIPAATKNLVTRGKKTGKGQGRIVSGGFYALGICMLQSFFGNITWLGMDGARD